MKITKSNTKRGLFALTFFLLLILTSVSVLGTNLEDYNTDQIQYSEFREQGKSSIRDYYNVPIGNFNSSDYGSSILNTVSSVGIDFEPIIFDFDVNGNGEDLTLVTFSGNFMEFYQVTNSGTWLNIGEYNTGSPVAVQPIAVRIGDDMRFIYANTTHIIQYNASGFVNASSIEEANSGIACQNMSDNLIHCYMAGNDTVGKKLNLIEYYPHNNTLIKHNLSSTGDWDRGIGDYDKKEVSPIIWDWDVDGIPEILIIGDPDADNDYGIYSISTATYTIEASISDMGGANTATRIGKPIIIDLDNLGDDELCLGRDDTTGGGFRHHYISCYNSDFSTYLSSRRFNDVSGSAVHYSSNIVRANINSTEMYCHFRKTTKVGNDEVVLSCFEGSTSSYDEKYIVTYSGDATYIDNYYNDGGTIGVADLDGDGNDEIISGSMIFTATAGGSFTNYTYSSINDGDHHVAMVNMIDDGYISIVTQSTNKILSFSNPFASVGGSNNSQPVIWANYGIMPDNPVCNDTLVKFSAKEDTDGALPLEDGTNYINDDSSDTEQLIIKIFNGINYTNHIGNFSETNPLEYITFDEIGTYYVTICLNDDTTLSNTTKLNNCQSSTGDTVVIYVIDGIMGSTCNTGSLETGSLAVTTTSISDFSSTPDEIATGWANLFDYLTGGNTTAKLFIGFILFLMFIVGFGVGLAKIGIGSMISGVILGISSILLFILLTIIGLFPIWLLVLLLLILSALSTLMFLVKSGGG